MSLQDVQAVNTLHPGWLQTNISSTCYALTHAVIDRLKSQGHIAAHICKTAGEGQYTPTGWVPHDVIGLDGHPYLITGVSHDAIWCDGAQFDLIARGNDSPNQIHNPDGSVMTGEPVWNAIPSEFWRPNNPPLPPDGPVTPPPPPPQPTIPSYESLGGDAFFRAHVGVPLQADMASVGQSLNDGSSVWFSRTAFDCIAARFQNPAVDIVPIARTHRNEWRILLGLPSL
jgi:hypothetical protein